MAIHHIVGGPFLKGTWEQALLGYQRILTRPPHLITIVREPIQHFLSCFYFFWKPDYGAKSSPWPTARHSHPSWRLVNIIRKSIAY